MSARLRLGRRLGAARLVLAKRLNFAAVLQLPLDVGLEWSELVQLFKSIESNVYKKSRASIARL